MRECWLCQKPVLVPKLVTTPIGGGKKKATVRDAKYEDAISAWKLVQAQPPGGQESILIFHCCTLALLQNPWQTPVTGHYWKQAGGPTALSWWPGFQFLYNVASNCKMAASPFTLKINQCQK